MNREALRVAIRQDLVRVARRHGCPEGVAPSITVYRDEGRFTEIRVRVAVGGYLYFRGRNPAPRRTWSEAMERYGLTPYSEAMGASEGALVEDLRRAAVLAGRGPDEMPTVDEYKEHGRWSWMTLYRRLGGGDDGSWYRVAEYARLRPARATRRGSLSPEKLVRDYRRVARELGYEPGGPGPSRREFDAGVPYSARNAYWHCGSLRNLQRAAGFEPRAPFGERAS